MMGTGGDAVFDDAAAYRHDALPYSGESDFVGRTVSFLAAGISAGEPGLLVSSSKRLLAVREGLLAAGSDVRPLTLIDTETDARNPAVVLSVMQDFVEQTGGRSVRGIGDLTRADWTSPAAAEAELHELLLNTPVTNEWNMWLACPYDSADQSAEGVATIEAYHPGSRVDMTNAVAEKFGSELPARPLDAETFPVDVRDLGTVRAIVRSAAGMAGLGEDKADGFVYAVNEVVSNSIRHGDGRAELSVWMVEGYLVCEVQDGGRITDPLAGRIPPALGRTSGRGLWMVNQLCDLVQVRSPHSGTCVRMFVRT